MTLKIVVVFTIVTCLNTMAQTAMERINKVYPSWTTNFDKKSIDLEELLAGGPPKDGIPAIINPKFTTLDEASNWLAEKEPVISVSINGMSKAYPLQILMFHEIVNDRIGRIPVLISFCPLCYSGLVFDRTLNGMAVNFGVSGLLRNSDLVMYDQLSESFWQQFTGKAIVGDFTGTKLKVIESQIISFADFKQNYPDGIVLSKNTGFKRPYGKNPYLGYDNTDSKPFLFDGENDERLKQNEKVIGVLYEGIAKAYPYQVTQNEKIIYDSMNNKEIVIFHLPGTLSSLDKRSIDESKDIGSTGVFSPIVDGERISFLYLNGTLLDEKTNSTWSITGKCLSGKLTGTQLSKIHHGDYFAFAWLAFYPNSKIYVFTN